MAIKLCSKKAVTIIEVIVVLVTASVVLLAVFSVMVSQFQYLNIFRIESALKGESIYIIERLKRAIANSERVSITVGGNLPLNVFIDGGAGAVQTGTFELTGTTLTYTDIATGATEVISDKIGSLNVVDDETKDPEVLTPIFVLNINLQVQDPNFPDVSGANIMTALACRLSLRTVENNTRNRRYLSIQGALDADEFVSGDEIRCMGENTAARFNGVFFENVNITENVNLRGGYNNVFADSPRNTTTTIDGGGAGSAIACNGSGLNVTIDGFTIQNGAGTAHWAGNTLEWVRGGGIYVNAPNSTVAITNNSITGNTAAGTTADAFGGGIYIEPAGAGQSNISISGNTITRNNLSSDLRAHGGGIYAGISGANSILTISNNTIGNIVSGIGNENTVNGGNGMARGGGIFVWPVDAGTIPTVTISNNIINGNNLLNNSDGVRGGGIWLSSDAQGATVGITGNQITNNIARGTTGAPGTNNSWGGGIAAWAMNGSFFTISGNTITGNRITDNDLGQMTRGGGILADISGVGGSFAIRNNIISGNISTAGHGGGIMAWANDGDTMNINNNVIARNFSDDGYGIFAIANENSIINIWNNTVANNADNAPPPAGGGINASATEVNSAVNIVNTICFGNDSPNINRIGNVIVSHSDIGDTDLAHPNRYPIPPVPFDPGWIHPSEQPLFILNINKPPVFVDAPNNDYHLRNENTDGGNRYIIDGGTGSDGIRPPGLEGTIADMGAYGGAGNADW